MVFWNWEGDKESGEGAKRNIFSCQLKYSALWADYKSLSISKAEFILHRTIQRYYYDGKQIISPKVEINWIKSSN